MTRKWKDHKNLMSLIKLVLIDEVHLLNEPSRGATLEVVVSRMKVIKNESKELRFIAISATCPNMNDISCWLKGFDNLPAISKVFGEEYRPVKLEKHVIPVNFSGNAYTFDGILNKK